MTAYYNEIDPFAAQWLRNLIAAGHIAPGFVDERDIRDVLPQDLNGYTQCHFFAGIGAWSLALRRAGWPDGRRVWTASCPCQPFSAAGAGAGFTDERHLWPHLQWLIAQHAPAVIFGEQVASKDAEPWIDLVQDDLEGMGYAVGAVPFPSAGVGAPHIRDRLYWMAYADHGGRLGRRAGQKGDGRDTARVEPQRLRNAGGLGDTIGAGLALGQRLAGVSGGTGGTGTREAVERAGVHTGGVADPKQHSSGCEAQAANSRESQTNRPADQHGGHSSASTPRPGPTNGFWRDADWLGCRDGKWRPVEPGTFPLAHGAPARVGRLRAYGNAINAEAARVFIECAIDYLDELDNTGVTSAHRIEDPAP